MVLANSNSFEAQDGEEVGVGIRSKSWDQTADGELDLDLDLAGQSEDNRQPAQQENQSDSNNRLCDGPSELVRIKQFVVAAKNNARSSKMSIVPLALGASGTGNAEAAATNANNDHELQSQSSRSSSPFYSQTTRDE